MTGTGIDVARLRKELEFVTSHPERWDQRRWAVRGPTCGTVACLAGTTVLHAELELTWARNVGLTRGRRFDVEAAYTTDGRHVMAAACDLLGLTVAQTDRLFNPSNTLRDLWELAAEFTAGEVVAPPDLPTWADAPPGDVP